MDQPSKSGSDLQLNRSGVSSFSPRHPRHPAPRGARAARPEPARARAPAAVSPSLRLPDRDRQDPAVGADALRDRHRAGRVARRAVRARRRGRRACGLAPAGRRGRPAAGRLRSRPARRWSSTPGLGSLTLALLPVVDRVVAVEVDPVLAGGAARDGGAARARRWSTGSRWCSPTRWRCATLPGPPPTALVANLPYNVSVPVVLRFLELFPSLRTILVMVQLEVAERLAAPPGVAHLRRAERQGGLVRRRAPRRARCRAACSGRCPTSTPGWSC